MRIFSEKLNRRILRPVGQKHITDTSRYLHFRQTSYFLLYTFCPSDTIIYLLKAPKLEQHPVSKNPYALYRALNMSHNAFSKSIIQPVLANQTRECRHDANYQLIIKLMLME